MHNDILSRTDLTASAKLIYSVLADRQGGNGDCWPGIRTLAKDAGMSKGAVERAVDALESAGLIQANRGNQGYSNRYTVTVPETGTLPASPTVPETETDCPQNGDSGVPKTDTVVSPKRVLKQTKEPDQLNQTKNQMPEPPEHLREVWPEWIESRKDIKKKLTPRMARGQLKKLSKYSDKAAVDAIEASIANGWQGLFPEQFETGPTDKRKRVDQILAEGGR